MEKLRKVRITLDVDGCNVGEIDEEREERNGYYYLSVYDEITIDLLRIFDYDYHIVYFKNKNFVGDYDTVECYKYKLDGFDVLDDNEDEDFPSVYNSPMWLKEWDGEDEDEKIEDYDIEMVLYTKQPIEKIEKTLDKLAKRINKERKSTIYFTYAEDYSQYLNYEFDMGRLSYKDLENEYRKINEEIKEFDLENL